MRHLAVSAAIAAVVFVWIVLSGRTAGDFRIDEVHKIGETYALRLVEEGRFHDREWFASAVERSNPPAGKYLFGLAIQLAGQPLPADSALARSVEHGARLPPPEWLARCRSWLRPVRFLTAAVTALTAALLFFMVSRAAGMLGGTIAVILYVTAFLTLTFAATAVFDPLLTLFVLASAAPLLSDRLFRSPGWDAALIATASLMAALAFQVRLSGLVALPAAIAILFIRAWRGRLGRAALLSIALGLGTLAIGTTINPFYWTTASDPTLPAVFQASEALPMRIVSRYRMQIADLTAIMSGLHEPHLGPTGTLQFVAEYAFGDEAGIALLGGVLLAAAAFALPRLRPPRSEIPLALWPAAVIMIFTAWLPLRYPRYVLLTIPPFAILAAIGWTSVWRTVRRGLAGKSQ
ncbi:MAG TPA: hypothetical protein VEZ11_04130 [Thermoanaerobaculia bacterium]|nr:hypothetical protein [Thermoanaerobaculia bacterium]